MALWLAKEFDWDTGRYTGRYYDIAEAGIVAVFVDSFYGDDASADPEDPDLPLKTLGAAITYLNTNGADGSRIFMNGIFSENLPTQTYWYEFIGCGGGWDGRTVWAYNETAETLVFFSTSSIHNKVHNVRTLNYGLQTNAINSASTSIYIQFLNCHLKGVRIWFWNSAATYPSYLTILDGLLYFAQYQSFFAGFQCILYKVGWYSGTNSLTLHGKNNYVSLSDTGGTIVGTAQNTILNTEAQFINPSQNDFSVRITSPLIGAGTVDELTGIAANVGGVQVGLPYNGITPEFTTEGGATITDLTIDSTGRITITAPATTGTLETALMDLGNIYPLENIDLFNVFDFASGEITQGVFEAFSSPRMALTIKLKYGLTSAEVDDCPWLLIEYGKQPTFSGTGSNRVGNAADTFDPDTFQEITCRYMKLFVTLQDNS